MVSIRGETFSFYRVEISGAESGVTAGVLNEDVFELVDANLFDEQLFWENVADDREIIEDDEEESPEVILFFYFYESNIVCQSYISCFRVG